MSQSLTGLVQPDKKPSMNRVAPKHVGRKREVEVGVAAAMAELDVRVEMIQTPIPLGPSVPRWLRQSGSESLV